MQLNMTVSKGIKTYMVLFFAKDGYLEPDSTNPHYFKLLELYKVLETFLNTLNKDLEVLENQKDKLVPEIVSTHKILSDALELWFKKLHEFQHQHREI